MMISSMFREIQRTKLNPALKQQLLSVLSQSSQNSSQGFTLMEVVVSILLLTTFMTVTMTTLVTASLVKIRANGLTSFTHWIEEDIEAVRDAARDPSPTSLPNSAKCNATAANDGYAKVLQDRLPTFARSGSQRVGSIFRTNGNEVRASQAYTLNRQTTIISTAPFEVLRLTYTVTDPRNNSTVATTYTEVIPNEAFKCARF